MQGEIEEETLRKKRRKKEARTEGEVSNLAGDTEQFKWVK